MRPAANRFRCNGSIGVALLAAVLVAGCSTTPATDAAGKRPVAELAPGIPQGYLAKTALPDSLDLLPAPPAPGSAAMAFDEAMHAQAVTMRGSARWQLAVLDADLASDRAIDAFQCTLGIPVDAQQTPRLQQMLQRILVDAAYSTEGAKRKYQRVRPFVAHGEAMCTPDQDKELRADGSYPSGHTALGWAYALVLAQVDPGRADRFIVRGRAYGESRMVCNVHWQSDVIAGRVMGAATVAHLQSVPEFVEDVGIARAEIARSRSSGTVPARDCASEAAALSHALRGAQ